MPVGLRPNAQASVAPLGVAVLMNDRGFVSASVDDLGTVVAQAQALLTSVLPQEVTGDPELGPRGGGLESIGVDYSAGAPNLLFSAVVPIAASELSDDAAVWSPLASSRTGGDDAGMTPERTMLLRYWRDQLLRTTAAFDFLPQYFPASQVRAIYSSVWGEEQQDANFQRWLLTAQDIDAQRIVLEQDSESVRDRAQEAFSSRVSRPLGAESSSIARGWDPKYVGISAGVAALGAGMGAIPAAAAAGAVVGSLVSWQRFRGAGRPPAWFSRRTPTRVELQTWYPARPKMVDGSFRES